VISLTATAKALSIGVIGGADGPTAIFVTSSGSGLWIWLLLAAVGAGGFLWLRKRRKNR